VKESPRNFKKKTQDIGRGSVPLTAKRVVFGPSIKCLAIGRTCISTGKSQTAGKELRKNPSLNGNVKGRKVPQQAGKAHRTSRAWSNVNGKVSGSKGKIARKAAGKSSIRGLANPEG